MNWDKLSKENLNEYGGISENSFKVSIFTCIDQSC